MRAPGEQKSRVSPRYGLFHILCTKFGLDFSKFSAIMKLWGAIEILSWCVLELNLSGQDHERAFC